ncbi:MAG: hypothetical protein AAF928_04515 [Myxococcota bacterium]
MTTERKSSPPSVGEALWAQIVSDPRADGPHDAYLRHCTEQDCLDEAARRYREARDALDDDEEPVIRDQYERRLAAIAVLAMAKLDVAPEPPRVGPWLRALQVVVAVLAGLSFLVLARALMS